MNPTTTIKATPPRGEDRKPAPYEHDGVMMTACGNFLHQIPEGDPDDTPYGGMILAADIDPNSGPLSFYKLGDRRTESGELILEVVPRWRVPAVLAGPQPLPLSCDAAVNSQEGGIIERVFLASDVRHCRCCERCLAQSRGSGHVPGEDRPTFACQVETPGGIFRDYGDTDEEFEQANQDAALYSKLWQGEMPESERGPR